MLDPARGMAAAAAGAGRAARRRRRPSATAEALAATRARAGVGLGLLLPRPPRAPSMPSGCSTRGSSFMKRTSTCACGSAAAGWRIVFTPAAEVVHHLGREHGRARRAAPRVPPQPPALLRQAPRTRGGVSPPRRARRARRGGLVDRARARRAGAPRPPSRPGRPGPLTAFAAISVAGGAGVHATVRHGPLSNLRGVRSTHEDRDRCPQMAGLRHRHLREEPGAPSRAPRPGDDVLPLL